MNYYDLPKEVLLGHLTNGKNVLWWRGYGAVAPDEITTNGNPYYLLAIREMSDVTTEGAAYFVGAAIYVWGHRICRALNKVGA